jgi:hypothetical protein
MYGTERLVHVLRRHHLVKVVVIVHVLPQHHLVKVVVKRRHVQLEHSVQIQVNVKNVLIIDENVENLEVIYEFVYLLIEHESVKMIDE